MWLMSELLEAVFDALGDVLGDLLPSMTKLGCRGFSVLLLVLALIGLVVYLVVS